MGTQEGTLGCTGLGGAPEGLLSCAQLLCGALLNTRGRSGSLAVAAPSSPGCASCVGGGGEMGLPCAEWAVGRDSPAVLRSDVGDGLASLLLLSSP